MNNILLIDDNREIHNSLRPIAAAHGYSLLSAYDGLSGLSMAQSCGADIIILDVMLPQSNGFALCRKIREAGCDTPVIFLTAKSDIVDKSIGFEAGGDDYMTKPFQSEELFMRISAVLRRTGSQKAKPEPPKENKQDVVLGDLVLKPSQYLVEKHGENVGLTALALLEPGGCFQQGADLRAPLERIEPAQPRLDYRARSPHKGENRRRPF